MPGGIVNKNTVLVFNNYESMRLYIPSGKNRIGIDNSTGNYYIFNDAKWVLFREKIPYSKADWYSLNRTLPLLSPPPTESIGTSLMQTAWVSTGKFGRNNLSNMLQTSWLSLGNYSSSFGGAGAGTNAGPLATGSFNVTVSASVIGV